MATDMVVSGLEDTVASDMVVDTEASGTVEEVTTGITSRCKSQIQSDAAMRFGRTIIFGPAVWRRSGSLRSLLLRFSADS